MRKRRKVTRAATAAALPLEGLPDIACAADGGRVIDSRDGTVFTRHCERPHGHTARDVGHLWGKWVATGEIAAIDVLDRLGDTF
jgi:hypothetical protein